MWKKLEISHKEIIEKYTKERFKTCDYLFSNLLLWSIGDNIEFLEEENTLYLRGSYLKRETYFLPIPLERENPNYFKGIDKLLSLGKEIELVPEQLYDYLGEKYELEETRDSFDYIYEVESLAYLKGRKYTKKRNKLNQFFKNYEYKFEKIDKENIDKVKNFQRDWYEKKSSVSQGELTKESMGVEIFLNSYDSLGLIGGILSVNNKVVAYTIGEQSSNDTMTILVEKADEEYSGSYQVINSIFLKEFGSSFTFVNREDDAGELGLREAKLSYYPFKLLKKYKIVKKII